MRAVAAIGVNTFREAVRDRVLYLFFGFAVLLLVGSKLFGLLTVGDQTKVMLDLGLAGIQLFAMLTAVMMGMLLISREVDNRTVFAILAKPVPRWQFVVGKYLGLVATVAVNVVAMTAVLLLMLLLYQGVVEPAVLLGSAMTLLEMLVVAGFATLFATLTRPILGSVMTLGVYVVGHLTRDLFLLTDHLSDPVTRTIITVLYHVLPNLERFNFTTEIVHDLRIPLQAVAWAVAYGVLYTGVVLVLACLRFRARDLT